MAVAWVKTSASGSNAFAFTPTTAGDSLLLIVNTSIGAGNGTCTGVSGSLSGTWTQVLATVNDGNGTFDTVFSLANCPSGADTLTLTFNGGTTPGTFNCWVSEFSGSSKTSPIIATVPAFNVQNSPGAGTDAITSGTQNVTLPAGAAGAVIVGLTLDLNGNAMSAGTGYTQRYDASISGAVLQVETSARITSNGNQTATATSTFGATHSFVSVLVALAEPAAFVVQERASTGGSGTSVALAFTNNEAKSSSNHVVVRALTSTSFTVTDSQSNTYTQRGSTLNDGAGGHFFAQFTADNIVAGANTATVTCSPSGTGIAVWIREIGDTIGFDTHVEQIQAGSSSATADAITTGTANPGFSPGLVSGFTNITLANPPALSAGSGFTSDGSPWGAGNSISQHRRYTSALAIASTTTASTTDSTNAFSFAALFKEVGAVAGKSLTGQTATFSQGQLGDATSYALTATTSTFTAGTLTPALSKSLTGQTATFGEGNLLNSINLAGQTATFTPGTITKFVSGNVTTSLSGISASFSEGNLSLSLGYILDSNFIILAGQTATFAQGTITATVSPAITASTATFTEGSITAGATTGPTYALTGQTATFTEGTISANAAGNITTQLSGQTATFSEGVLLDAFSYSLTAQTITSTEGLISFSVTGDQAFQLTGQISSFIEGIITPFNGVNPPVLRPPGLGPLVTSRQFSWKEMAIRAWGSEYSAPDHRVYQFSNGRSFDSTDQQNTGIYRKPGT